MSSIPYVHKSDHILKDDPARQMLRVRIEPQYHEMLVPREKLYQEAQHLKMPMEEALPHLMIELLREQACVAYDTVMRGGLSALAGRPMERDEVDSAIQSFVEWSALNVEAADKERDKWKELADRRKIEIETLERVLRGRA